MDQLIYEEHNGITHDHHYEHFHRLCRPCSIQYDYIGRFENLPEEANTLLKLRNIDDLLSYRSPWVKPQPAEKLTSRDAYLLPKMIRLDRELFGYEEGQFAKTIS